MTPIEMIKEGIKVKSWAMVKAALKELEEKPTPIPTENISLNKFEGHLNNPRHTGNKNQSVRQNLFYDDGNTTMVGDTPIDSAQADLNIKYKEPTPRTRSEYKPKYLDCTICSKKKEVSDLEYSYYKNPQNEADYVCQNCI